MKKLVRSFIVVLLAGGWLAAKAGAQTRPRPAASSKIQPAAGKETKYGSNLRDPFSPIGYRAPMSEWQASADVAAVVSNVPPPSVDLISKAKSLLRIKGIVKSGSVYVANVSGAIVRTGDEVGVMVDGREVTFIIRSISLLRVEIEPK